MQTRSKTRVIRAFDEEAKQLPSTVNGDNSNAKPVQVLAKHETKPARKKRKTNPKSAQIEKQKLIHVPKSLMIPPTFENMPNDIILRIADAMGPFDLIHLSQLNRKVYTCFSNEYFQKRFTLDFNVILNVNLKNPKLTFGRILAFVCQDCEDMIGSIRKTTQGQNLCKACRSSEEGEKITFTRAKSDYKLNDGDLAGLSYSEHTNPHYRSGYPMRLYEIEDVEDKSRQKFRRKVLEKVIARAPTLKALKGPAQRISATDAKAKRRQLLTEACTEAGITDMEHDAIFSQFIRTGRGGKKSIPELIQNHLQKGVRRVTLINALAVEHLELRYDSKLCEAYISEGQGTLESIVSTMVDMHIIHEHSVFNALFENARADHHKEIEENRTAGIREWVQFDYEEVRGDCEGEALGLFERAEAILPPIDSEVCHCGRRLLADYIIDHLMPKKSNYTPQW